MKNNTLYTKTLPKKNNYHTCKRKDKTAIINKWQEGDGYKELVGKWTIDDFGFDGGRILIVISFCPFCGVRLK